MQKFKIIVFIALIGLIAACGNKNKDDKDRNATEQSVYETSQKHLQNSNWSAAQSIQSKDPALSFLLLLEKEVRGERKT